MITMVIATYNHAHYLQIQLASIIRQGANISRIIVVNDASTDDTADVLEKMQMIEHRLMHINLPNNVGCLNAQHIGLQHVDTDFFAFAAADDFLMPDWAEKSLNALMSSSDVGLCFSNTYIARETSAALSKTIYPKRLRGAVLSPSEFHRSVMRYGTWMSSNTVLYRKCVYDEKFVKLASAGAFVDGLILYMLGLKYGAVVVDEPLGVFFVRETSMSGATVMPRVGIKLVQELSNVLKTSLCVKIIDRRLAFRMLRRNTYVYLMGSIHHLTSEFSQITEKTLPLITSKSLRILLCLSFNLCRFMAFVCLRPFDLMKVPRMHSKAATLDEKHALVEYQKALNDSLQSMGVDS